MGSRHTTAYMEFLKRVGPRAGEIATRTLREVHLTEYQTFYCELLNAMWIDECAEKGVSNVKKET